MHKGSKLSSKEQVQILTLELESLVEKLHTSLVAVKMLF